MAGGAGPGGPRGTVAREQCRMTSTGLIRLIWLVRKGNKIDWFG
jgi:hypothetical protein